MAAIKLGDFVKITFQDSGDVAITQLDTGTVCLYLQDTVTYVGVYHLTNVNQIPTTLAEENQEYLRLAFRGKPRKVIAVVQEGTATALDVDTTKLGILETLTFDYLAFPGIDSTDATAVATWVEGVNANPIHRFSCVLPNMAGDDWHIINFTQETVTVDGKVYNTSQATAYAAGAIAAVVPNQSMTMHTADVDSCSAMTIAEIDEAGEDGELVMFDDGDNVRFANDTNSLTTLDPTTQDESYQDIRCVAIMDLFYNSCKIAILEKYIGKYANTYQNKLMLVGEIYGLLKEFENAGLCEQGDTNVSINLEAQTSYLRSISYRTADGRGVDDMTQDEILRANTKKKVFLKVRMIPVSAIEAVEILVET